jgi:hypothetical protein
MKVNARIKSKLELLERMGDGELFYLDETTCVFFSPKTMELLNRYAEMTTEREAHWTDDLVNGPILCRVWNDNRGVFYRDVIDFKDGMYETRTAYYEHAEPVTPDMCWKPRNDD